ncbi:MAG: MFS transporter [Candidatus Cloacimonetes bacterium]|nr:MFS transporter [Candidatus Cloacimonadota bacterium]
MLFKKIFYALFTFILKVLSFLTPSLPSLKWASKLIFIFIALVIIVVATPYFKPIGLLFTAAFIITIFLISLLSGLLFNLIISLLIKIPEFFRTTLVALLIFTLFLFSVNTGVMLLTFLYLATSVSLVGISLYIIIKQKKAGKKTIHRIANYLLLVIGLAAIIAWAYWLIHPGREVEMPLIASLETDYRPALIELPNPAEYGHYPVVYTTYGSGKDLHRPEFGENTELITQPVDGSKMLSSWKGFSGNLRTKYFGFDAKELPLNGRVWYPDGVGPFPLILIVHGNHLAQEYSDPGYAYLGELWASRGMITVSVDQNFINGSITDIFGGLSDENDARGWLLLEHIRQWKEWEEKPDNPFYRRVDLDYIALIGHSRGGEAIAHAALFNTLPYYPDDASLAFDYNFSIVSLIAIAPCDAQYQPSVVRTPLRDINYLALHGSHDADVTSFSGQRQFERITFSPDFEGFAATLYIYGANHGQFNTVWGRKDSSSPHINHYNLGQLISGEDQRRIGKVFMTAFLERTLMFAPEYEELFLDYRSAPQAWLPETIYLQQYKRAGMYPIANFDEDLDLTTTTIADGTIRGDNLTDWYERRIRLKGYSMDSKAVYLGWNAEEDTLIASYNIELPSYYNSQQFLYLTLADTGNQPTAKEKNDIENNEEDNQNDNDHDSNNIDQTPKEEDDEDSEAEEPKLIDFTIRLTDHRNNIISFPLSDFSPLQPMIEAKLGKLDLIHPTPYGESIKQLFVFNLAEQHALNPDFDLRRVSIIELVFDITPKGHILVNEVGFMTKR